jgi:DNA-directed RNA polymerase subunit RPC12/RpoP
MPPLRRQAWNLASALAAFVADGCWTLTADQYRERLVVCDTCEHRRRNRCRKCGCRLAIKAKGRAFRCPEDRWPNLEHSESPTQSPS